MESDKVYIVTSGDYSDYTIEAVFSTIEKAKEYVDAHGSDYCIEKYPVDDAEVKKNESIWLVSVKWKTGEVISANSQNYSEYYADKEGTVQYKKSCGEYLDIVLISDSMTRATKVASERFMQVKALHEVKFPLLMKECVIEDGYIGKIYPVYDYNTGKILLYEDTKMRLAPGFDAPVEHRKETDNQ